MIRPLLSGGIFLGLQFETDRALFFFGSRHMGRDDLTLQFPQYRFCFLKQIHGNQIVHGEPDDIWEADGHFTGKPGHALVVQTADCLPILLASDSQVCALHAGWRGIATNIIGTSKIFFVEPPLIAVLGPHIQCESFEIGEDVMGKLLAAAPNGFDKRAFVRTHPQPGKVYFDLGRLARAQLTREFPAIQIFETGEDTFTNPAFHSFRRDKSSAGRQYNFVVLKP